MTFKMIKFTGKENWERVKITTISIKIMEVQLKKNSSICYARANSVVKIVSFLTFVNGELVYILKINLITQKLLVRNRYKLYIRNLWVLKPIFRYLKKNLFFETWKVNIYSDKLQWRKCSRECLWAREKLPGALGAFFFEDERSRKTPPRFRALSQTTDDCLREL